MDAEFNAIKVVLDAILARLPFIQRDDGYLANASVTAQQLSPSLSIGFTLRGVWAPNVNYNYGDGVSMGTVFYRCLTTNLSTSGPSGNAPNIATGIWQEVADLASIAGAVTYAANQAPDGTAAAPGLGFQSEADGFFKQAAGVIGVSIQGVQQFLINAAGILLPADPTLALQAATKHYVDSQIAILTNAEIGILKPLPASGIPANHVLCYGQTLLRTTPLFGVYGTTYGAGDGLTTFNNIDMRGFGVAGVDNMGGTAAGRLTAESIVGGALTVGNVGGEETHMLLAAELAAHLHSITDTGHTHTASDAGHTHTVPEAGGGIGATAGAENVASTAGTSTGTGYASITVATASTGITQTNSTAAGVAHNNVQPTRVANWITRYQ
jgi:microcystin-dependent protein